MATKRIKKYRMIPIPAKFSEKGGCTAQFVAGDYSVDAEAEILPDVIEANGVKISRGTAWDLVNSFIKACAQRAANTGETVTVGSLLSFGLSIRGWYERTDSKASRDNVRVTATLLGDLRPNIEFGMSNALEGVKLKLYSIRGVGLPVSHVKGGTQFQINGLGLDLVEGDTVTAKAVTADGDAVEAACEVVSAEPDRLDAILPAAFAAPALVGREVKVSVTSHCGDPTASPDIRTIAATIDAASTPAPDPTPAPTGPTLATVNGDPAGSTVDAMSVTLGGTGLADATLKISYTNGSGEAVERALTTESVSDTAIVLPNGWDTQASDIPDGEEVTFIATTEAGSAHIAARYHA